MGFIDNVVAGFGNGSIVEPPFKVLLLGDCSAYFTGITGIKSFSSDEITVTLKKGTVTVKGSDLFVKKYCAGDLAVCGKIKSIEKS